MTLNINMNMTGLSEIEKDKRKHLANTRPALVIVTSFQKLFTLFFFSLHLRAPSRQIQISSWPFRSSGSSSLPLPDIVHYDR